MMELRSCLEGDQASRGGLEGELRKLANRVMSVGIAEIVLRSPIVSSWIVLSSRLSVSVNSSKSSLASLLISPARSGEPVVS